VQLVHDVSDGVVDDGGLGQLSGRVLVELGQVLRDHRVGVAKEGEKGGDREQKDRDEPNDRDPHVAPNPVALPPLHVLPLPTAAHPYEALTIHGAAIIQKGMSLEPKPQKE
jgi:hypothetical protein